VRRSIAVVVMIGFCGSQVLAADLQSAIAHAVEQAAPAAPAGAKTENPNLWPGIGLIGADAALLIYGTSRTTERFCNGVPPALTSQLNQPAVSCVDNTHGKPALMIAGIVAASVGGAILAIGEKKRASVAITPGGIFVQQRIPF
jgi:hypothetical protein